VGGEKTRAKAGPYASTSEFFDQKTFSITDSRRYQEG